MNAAIETTSLTRDFGKFRAVNELNLRVEAGRFYGFLGPNGAGKSTTIKMLTGLLAPSGGAIRILGEDVADPKRALAVKQRIGVVPENLALFDNLTARCWTPPRCSPAGPRATTCCGWPTPRA